MFLGTHYHSVDAKNRLTVPAKFRMELGKEFVISRNLQGCLTVYTMQAWKELTDKFKTVSITDREGQQFKRFITAGAMDGEIDSQGRILLKAEQKKIAGIDKDVAIVGNVDNFEIWDAQKWKEFDDSSLELISENPDAFKNLNI